jgi:hypothetical protein
MTKGVSFGATPVQEMRPVQLPQPLCRPLAWRRVLLRRGNTQTYTGVVLAPGGTAWIPAVIAASKDNLRDIDVQDVLQRLLALPITIWNLNAQDPSIRHLGPMAHDFRAAFGLGETELGINTLDADGVAFAAIQGLNAKLEREVVALRAELAEIRLLLSESSRARSTQTAEIRPQRRSRSGYPRVARSRCAQRG